MPEVSYADVQDVFSDTKVALGTPTTLSNSDSQKLGQSNNIQYTEPKPPPEPNLGERLAEDVEKPFIQAQHQMGAGMYWLGDNLKNTEAFGNLGDRIARAGIIQQERATRNLQENFSNFTPNKLDDLIGAVPTIAGFLGLAAASTAGIAVGATAGLAGAGIAAEEYVKFKAQGHTTPESDALALAIGIPTTGVMAAGFGIAGKLVEPWFKPMLGATISKVIGNMASGAAGLGAQAATVDTGEFATGAEKFKGSESVVKTLTDTANGAIMGGILGGTVGLPFALKQHAEFVKGLRDQGLSTKDAQQAGNAILGQGSHVLMDALEKHLGYSKDEQARVQSLPNGEVKQPESNILDRGGIPNDLLYSPLEPLSQEDGTVALLTKDFKYVKVEPLNLNFKLSDTATAEDIRYKYTGNENKQLGLLGYLHQDLKKITSSELEQNAMFMNDVSPELMQKILEHPDKAAAQIIKEVRDLHGDNRDISATEIKEFSTKLREMAPIIDQILHPTEGMIEATKKGDQYYKEQGIVSKAFGTIDEARANYQSSRLYKAEPLSGLVKLSSSNKTFSAHSLERYYDNKWQALADGKEFRTMNYADALLDHGIEHTLVNHSRQLMDAMSKLKPIPLGQWVRQVPDSWQQIGTTSKTVPMRDSKTGEMVLDEQGNQQQNKMVFAAPKGIANGLKALVDPNYFKNIRGYKELNEFQGIVKTGMVSASLYHHETIAAQILSSLDGYKTLSELPKVLKDDLMSEPGFRANEQVFLGYGGDTTILHENQDIMKLMDDDGKLSRIVKAPFIKEISKLADANNRLLFHGMQRYGKVMTFSRNMAKWEGEHPGATQEEIDAAGRGYAKSTNAQFGGLNWRALGIDRSALAFMRLTLLAPDWVVSSILKTKYAVGGGTAGSQSRWSLGSAVLGGIAVNQLINYMYTGHSTLENKKGHWLEAETAPDVYTNTVRGAPGELLKMMADVYESEGAQGFARYGEGKFSPVLSAGTTFFSGVNYAGQNIWKGDNPLQKNVNGFWNVFSHVVPAPFAISGAVSYAQREQNQSPTGWGLIASGLGRFSKPSESIEKSNINANVIHAYRNGNTEYVEHLIDKGDLSQEQADKLREESAKADSVRHIEHLHIKDAIKYYQKSSPDDQSKMKDMLEDKYQRYLDSDNSPNEKQKVKRLYSTLKK